MTTLSAILTETRRIERQHAHIPLPSGLSKHDDRRETIFMAMENLRDEAALMEDREQPIGWGWDTWANRGRV